jgi:hypothetical protein
MNEESLTCLSLTYIPRAQVYPLLQSTFPWPSLKIVSILPLTPVPVIFLQPPLFIFPPEFLIDEMGDAAR